MAITALSEDTVRQLGSYTIITTPVDLVKELLDNAIDAKATSVDILVSPNTVDRIEVRDNGHGIHADDYISLGHAGHTSKISSFEDVYTLGGTTLGFRGQALAAANNLGTVIITTRVAEDPTALELKLIAGVGGVESQLRTSAPTGTTVSVTGLYSHQPVRQQVAIKEAPKNLVRIKKILQAYALARPQVRLSLRILGGDGKQTFSYSPRTQAGVKEALVQVFSTEVASQCLVKTICSGSGDENREVTGDNEHFSLEAVLPMPDADHSRICKGTFFSVDSRPVSAQRETMKKLLASFKAHFSKFLDLRYGESSFRDTFICVNIRCPPGSYDPNIEPSKNVVLFKDDSQIIRLFDLLCSDIYSRQESVSPFMTIARQQLLQGRQPRTPPPSSDSPECEEPELGTPNEMPKDPITQLQRSPLLNNSSPVRELPEGPAPRRRPAPVRFSGRGLPVDMSADPNMSSDEEAEMIASLFRQEGRGLQVEREDEEPMESLNPWTIAKMNAPARQKGNAQPSPEEQPPQAVQVLEQSGLDVPDEEFENLPVLQPLGKAPGELRDHRTTRLGIISTRHEQFELPGFQHPLDYSSMTSPGSCDALQPRPQTEEINVNRQLLPGLRYAMDMQPAASLPTEGTRNDKLDGLAQSRLVFGGHTSDSQNKRNSQVQRHINDIPSKHNPPFCKPKRVNKKDRRSSAPNHGHLNNYMESRLDDCHRLIDDQSGSLGHPDAPRLYLSPGPGSGSTLQAQSTSSLSRRDPAWVDEDSRKYLMKRQLSEAKHRRNGRQPLKRVKTDKLPLENVPDRQGIHDLVLIMVPDTTRFANSLENMIGDDTLCHSWNTEVELTDEMTIDDAVDVELRMKGILYAWTETVLGERSEVNLDLRSQVKGKRVAL